MRVAAPLTLALGSAALLVASCDDPAPPPDVRVLVAARTDARLLNLVEPPVVYCDVEITASATGDDGAEAFWEEAIIQVYGGTDRAAPVAELTFVGDVVRQAFGAAAITPGERQALVWDLSAPLPFEGRLVQRYRTEPGGEARAAEVGFLCGPTVADGDPPAATIQELAPVAPEPGYPVILRYQASSGPGLWTVQIDLAAGDWLGRWIAPVPPAAPAWSDTMLITLPWDLPVGVPLAATVTAVDLAGRRTEATRTSESVLADHTPPALVVEFPCGGTCAVASGTMLDVTVHLADASDHRLTYSLGDPAVMTDSLEFEPGSRTVSVRLPIEPGITGPHPLTFGAADAVGHITADTLVATLDVYPGTTADIVRADVPGLVTDLLIDERRGLLYLARPLEGDLLALAEADLAVVASIPMAGGPVSADLSPTGDSILVALQDAGAVAVLDAATRVPLGQVALGLAEGFSIRSLRTTRNGAWLVHAERDLESYPGYADAVLLLYPSHDGEPRSLATARRERWSRLVASDDRSRIATAVDCPRIFDADAGQLGPCGIGVIRELATDGTGRWFADTDGLLTADLQRVPLEVLMSAYATAADLTPDGRYLLAGFTDYVDVLSVADDGRRILRLHGAIPDGRLEVFPGGGAALAWGFADTRPVPDLESTPVARLDLAPLPDGGGSADGAVAVPPGPPRR